MGRFLQDAIGIFESANAIPYEGESSDMAILVDGSGCMRIVDGAGWSPEALESHYGARTVYNVTRNQWGVRVEGRSAGSKCAVRITSGEGKELPLRLNLEPWRGVCAEKDFCRLALSS